jgi:hypothetical protein
MTGPSKPEIPRGSIAPRIQELLDLVVVAIPPLGVPYAIGGGLAVCALGYMRHTKDVDLFVRPAEAPQVVAALRRVGLVVVPVMEPLHYIATLPGHRDDPEVRIAVLMPYDEPEATAIEQPCPARLVGHDLDIFQPLLLAAAKFYANREEDDLDLAQLFGLGLVDPARVRAIIASFDPGSVQAFDAKVREILAPRHPRPRPPRRPPPPVETGRGRRRKR